MLMAKHVSYLINGNSNQAISPLDRGFAYGDGVFRTLVMREGQPENWPLHYQKLVADCAAIKIVCPSADMLINDLGQLFLPSETAVAKIIVTRGEGERGYAPPAITAPMRVVVKTTMPDYPKSYSEEGVNLHVCKTQLAAQPLLAGVKHLNRLENVLARMEWNDPTIADGIMFDTQNNVIECTAANIFARFNDTLKTPNLNQCGIAGITRQRIIDHAHLWHLKIKIEQINLEQLLNADEVIISNSLFTTWQVQQILHKNWQPSFLANHIRKTLAYDKTRL